MLSVEEATEAILGRCQLLPPVSTALGDALGRVLAEDIVADIDLPPFDKALMDGYAVRSADLAKEGDHGLVVVDEITAGRTPSRPIGPGEAARIMTGAPLPSGADAVVMVERSRMDGPAVILPGPVAPGSNRLTRGREMRAGDVLLTMGTPLDGTKLGLIASAGRDEVRTIPKPTVAVVPTGDELVSPSERPGPGQIRNSNGVMLAGLVRGWGFPDARECPVAPDDPDGLRASLARELEGEVDVLIISGGVSAGTRDLVPSALIDLGVEPVFHKVRVRPGKPLWFGVGPRRPEKAGILVFGLPGNPASGVVGFLLFVRPALEALAGRGLAPPRLIPAPLETSYSHRGDRPTYHPARLEGGRVTPLDWAGSADLRAIALADGFARFAAGDRAYREGDGVDFLPLRP